MKERDLKIFVIDDDIFTAEVYNQSLKNFGYYDTYYFSNGDSCIEGLYDKPNIVLLDDEIDGESCIATLKQIKLLDPSIYVIVLSSDRGVKNKLETLQFGAFDFLIKDKNVCAKIANVIDHILKISENLRKSI